MAVASMKNAPLTSGVAADIGLGDQLQQQVQEEIAARKKKLLKPGMNATQAVLGPATASIFNGTGGING